MPISGGKYAAEVLKGRGQILSTAAAGGALPISTGTGITFGVWNTSPNMYAIPLWARGGYTSGTIALGTFGWANQAAGYATATGGPITAWTDATSATLKNALTGGGNASVMRYTPSGGTLTSGGTAALWSGPSIESATPGTGIFPLMMDFDGSVIIAPGQVFFACCSVAQTALFSLSLAVAEVPIAS